MPDLTTYTWRELTPASHPTVNEYFGFTWAGTKGVLFGGGGDMLTYSDETWLLEGEEWRQAAPSSPPSARWLCSMAWNGTNVILFGGYDSGSTILTDTWSFDLVTEEWTELFPANAPTIDTWYGLGPWSMVWDGSRIVLQIETTVVGLTPQTWQYASSDWTNIAPANQPSQPSGSRAWPAITYGNGTITLFGGTIAGAIQPVIDDVFNPDGATWGFGSDWTKTAAGSYPNPYPNSDLSGGTGTARHMLPIAHTGTEILLFGGHIYDVGFIGTQSEDDTWMLDGSGWTELPQATHPAARYWHGLIYDDVTQRFFLYGGYSDTLGDSIFWTDTWVFEPPAAPIQVAINDLFGLGQ